MWSYRVGVVSFEALERDTVGRTVAHVTGGHTARRARERMCVRGDIGDERMCGRVEGTVAHVTGRHTRREGVRERV